MGPNKCHKGGHISLPVVKRYENRMAIQCPSEEMQVRLVISQGQL